MLAQYERASSWLRAAAGGVVFLMAAAVPPGLLALSVFVVHGDLASYAVGLASLSTTWLPAWAWKQRCGSGSCVGAWRGERNTMRESPQSQ